MKRIVVVFLQMIVLVFTSCKKPYIFNEKDKTMFESLEMKKEIKKKNSKKTEVKENESKKRDSYKIDMVKIPDSNFEMGKTEITREQWKYVITYDKHTLGGLELTKDGYRGLKNSRLAPSIQTEFKNLGNSLPGPESASMDTPVVCVTLEDIAYFCNKLSKMEDLEPVYIVNGTTDINRWNYTPGSKKTIVGLKANNLANGYRLPTLAEWKYAAKGGENFAYSGSNDINEVAWYYNNGNIKTHPVAQKKPNGYGIYDMSGNVCEYFYEDDKQTKIPRFKRHIGGSYSSTAKMCQITDYVDDYSCARDYFVGFRVVRTIK